MNVDHWDEKKDGPLTEAALQRKIEKRGFDVSVYTYPPGTVFPDHQHSTDKIDAVLSGQFRLATPEEEVLLEAGDLLLVPKGTVHRAEVVGEEPVVSLDGLRTLSC